MEKAAGMGASTRTSTHVPMLIHRGCYTGIVSFEFRS